MRLNTLGRRLLLRRIYMQDCYVHRLISNCILQNLIMKYIEIHLYFQVHPFGIPFLHIFIVKAQYLRWVNS